MNLSVVIATCNRPGNLAQCLHQLQNQITDGLDIETIVIDESDDHKSETVVQRYASVISIYKRKPKEGLCGAYAKDFGISIASGEYVCFWDDDNIYYPNALSTLYASAYHHDIGVVQTHHYRRTGECVTIPKPWRGNFEFKQIDTMCVCVRTELAEKQKWSDHKDRGTDYHWLHKLESYKPKINFVPLVIGSHL